MPQISHFEFRDFDSFREQLRGWDTEPIQIGAGPLRVRWDALRFEGFDLARLGVNRRIADTSAVEAGTLGFVVTLRPHVWCGMEVPTGSLVVCAPGRDHRAASTGFRSVEISASEDLLQEVGLLEEGIDPRAFPPERCVIRLGPGLVADFRELASELAPPGRAGAHTPVPWRRASSLQHRALGRLVTALRERGVPGIRPVARYELAERALRQVEDNAEERLTVRQLADVLDVTPRALEYSFASAFGASPARFLLARRLTRVRRELVADSALTVTQAAVHEGFDHLGRFAGHYRRLFGELPSETLRAVIRASAP